MSADLLRRAASKAREVAEAATPVDLNNEPIPWHNAFDGTGYDDEDAEHIWLWSPTVALAVADWLDEVAEHLEVSPHLLEDQSLDICAGVRAAADECSVFESALTIARLLLGEAADV